MNDNPRRRRSPLVVVLDALLGLATAVQAGPWNQPKVRAAGRDPRRGRLLLMAGVLAAVVGTVLLILLFIRMPAGLSLLPRPASVEPGAVPSSPSPSPAAPASPTVRPTPTSPTGTPTRSTGSSATPSASASAVPGVSGSGSASVAPIPETATVPLAARLTTTPHVAGLLGYEVTVAVTNPGSAPRDGWQLTVTLPRETLVVTQVSGATAEQDGGAWTFTPDGSTAHLPPGGQAQVTFEVRGATLVNAGPQDCRIDGNPCG